LVEEQALVEKAVVEQIDSGGLLSVVEQIESEGLLSVVEQIVFGGLLSVVEQALVEQTVEIESGLLHLWKNGL
jgi:hypothetical protein